MRMAVFMVDIWQVDTFNIFGWTAIETNTVPVEEVYEYG